jgi:hypothetical protein
MTVRSTQREVDYKKYCDLERYLFEEVTNRFRENGHLTAFDFFCIIIWKANRAKSKIARKLIQKDYTDLDDAVRALTSGISIAEGRKAKLRVLIEDWSFRLPMASAIATVLYPDGFSVYDVRVCDQLNDFHKVQNKKFETLWDGYCDYLDRVTAEAPIDLKLRDKDRWLWGRSFHDQLIEQIANNFTKDNIDTED